MTAPAPPFNFGGFAGLGGPSSQRGGRKTGAGGVFAFYIKGFRGQGGLGGHLRGYIYTRKKQGDLGCKIFLIENLQMSSLTSLSSNCIEKKERKGVLGKILSSLLGGSSSQNKDVTAK